MKNPSHPVLSASFASFTYSHGDLTLQKFGTYKPYRTWKALLLLPTSPLFAILLFKSLNLTLSLLPMLGFKFFLSEVEFIHEAKCQIHIFEYLRRVMRIRPKLTSQSAIAQAVASLRTSSLLRERSVAFSSRALLFLLAVLARSTSISSIRSEGKLLAPAKSLTG